MVEFMKDFVFGSTKYPCALFKPKVFNGYFGDEEHHKVQYDFYLHLMGLGFKRTLFQLVFPGQTAGIIKRVPTRKDGVNEYHIRFYEDGTIDCELEVTRWSTKHWSGTRHRDKDGKDLLVNILEFELVEVPQNQKDAISKLFGYKPYTTECIRN